MKEEKLISNLKQEQQNNKLNSSAMIKEILEKPTKLSEDQSKAVLSKSRYNRIIAGAGAGKTETLTRKIAILLLVDKVEPSSIVAFTFTEKAAQSMKSRIYERIEELSGAEATAELGEMYVGTIHAYAKRILDDHFHYGNYSVLDENQEIAFLMRHGWSLGLNNYRGFYAENCRRFLRALDMVLGELIDEDELQKRAPEFYYKLKKYEGILDSNKQLTFARMISQTVLNLRESPETLSHIRHLLVDEYQDINRAQQEFIELIGRNGTIFVVGDPRQSIYQWRGSNEKFFEDFTETFPNTDTVTIHENRRSTTKIVYNANRFADSFESINFEPMEPTRPEEGFIGVASLRTPEDEARWIANQIEDLVVNKNKISFSDIGILTRSVGTSAGPLIAEFKQREIPYIVGGKVGLFKRDEAQALGRIFSWFSDGFWVEDPWNWGKQVKGDLLLTTGLQCWEKSHKHGLPEDSSDKLREIKRDLNSEASSYRNLTQIYQDVLLALGFTDLVYDNIKDVPVMANLGRFNNLLTDYETANRIGGRSIRWARDLKGLCWFINSYGLKAYEENPSNDIRGITAVQLMTIHQAKGLEWPIVFLFANVNRRFPASLVGREQFWFDIPRDMFDAERYEGSIEDERRLFYVAITRARDSLILSYFREMKNRTRRSMFLDNIDEGLITGSRDSEPLPEFSINANILSEELQTFSAGELITYNMCPYMYLLRELWGYQPGLSLRLGYGNALHYCLRRAGELIKDEGYSPISAVATSVDEGFHMPFVGGSVLETFKNGALKVLISFSKKYGDDLRRIKEVEYRLEYHIQNATIIGKVDVVLRDGGEMEVWDYKTSEETRTFEEASDQVRLYILGLKSLKRPVSGGSIAYLEEPTVKTVDIDDALLTEANDRAKKNVENIINREFNPNPGKNCQRCDHKTICAWSVD